MYIKQKPDHGTLAGLGDDDHPQYATNAEFDDHSIRHEAGGDDALTIDAAAGTGSLRTIGTTATAAAAGNHTHAVSGTTGGWQKVGEVHQALTNNIVAHTTVHTISGLSIPTDRSIMIIGNCWKGANAAAHANVGLIMNSTAVLNGTGVNSNIALWSSDATNEVQEGGFFVVYAPRANTSYLRGGWGGWNHYGTSPNDTTILACFNAAQPNAVITSLEFTVYVSNTAISCGIRDIEVFMSAD